MYVELVDRLQYNYNLNRPVFLAGTPEHSDAFFGRLRNNDHIILGVLEAVSGLIAFQEQQTVGNPSYPAAVRGLATILASAVCAAGVGPFIDLKTNNPVAFATLSREQQLLTEVTYGMLVLSWLRDEGEHEEDGDDTTYVSDTPPRLYY